MGEHHPHPDDDHQPEGGPAGFLDPFAVARGFLAVALERCDPASDAALEICAAWAELDEPGIPPEQVDTDIPDVFPPDVILGIARASQEEADHCSRQLRKLFPDVTIAVVTGAQSIAFEWEVDE